MIGKGAMTRVLLLALLLAGCGSAEEPGAMANGAAAPEAGEPDNRIECRSGDAARFERACTVESADTADGRILTLRKADGGFRRLRETAEGRFRRRGRGGARKQHRLARRPDRAGDRRRPVPVAETRRLAMTGRVILTAAGMRAAEEAAIAAGTPVEELMERAGLAAAEAIWRYAGPLPALVLCGPGNNGGDGYVIARALQARGMAVRVAALAEPKSEAARKARAAWGGPVEALAGAEPAPLLIDALFGTGLARPLDEAVFRRLCDLPARVRVAVDLPSGVATDDGRVLSPVPDYDLTLAFQTLKPSHLLQPAARHMGRLVVADIGIEAAGSLHEIGAPELSPPGPDDHKFSRGLVTIVAGDLAGAAALAAAAAVRSGAGVVRLQARDFVPGVPAAVVQRPGDPLDRLDDPRIGALLIGPGLIEGGEDLLEAVLASGHPLVLDAGALRLLGARRAEGAILTPHDGEFRAPVRRAGGKQGRTRPLGGGRERGRDRLQGPGHGGRGAGRARRNLPAQPALAGDGGHRRRARRSDRSDARARDGAVRGGLRRGLAARARRGARRAGPDRRRPHRSPVSETETIVRLAARGDGVTESGRFVPMTAPGDTVTGDGVVPGPHRQRPPCRHFPECGGCQLQHVDDEAYADYLGERIASALAAQGLAGAGAARAPSVAADEPPARGSEGGRRPGRLQRRRQATESSTCANAIYCAPNCSPWSAPLRRLLRGRASAAMTLADQGVDLLLEGVASEGLEAAEAMTAFARENQLARLALDDGYGAQTVWEPEPVTATLGGTAVALPHGAFLQATADGEAALVAAVREAVAGAGVVADLFAGLGTFALALPGKVYAAEGARDAALALKAAGGGVFVEHRDLYRRPLDAAELARFEAAVLDPPRAGAKEQVAALAASPVPRIAYVSCNPATFARDARTADRRRLPARLGQAGRPVPLVDPCRAGRRLRKIGTVPLFPVPLFPRKIGTVPLFPGNGGPPHFQRWWR